MRDTYSIRFPICTTLVIPSITQDGTLPSTRHLSDSVPLSTVDPSERRQKTYILYEGKG